MTRIPRPSPDARHDTISALRRQFPAWTVAFDDVHHTWNAERRAGTSLRLIVAHRPDELAAKLVAAERDADRCDPPTG